jgi:hypothetical protein
MTVIRSRNEAQLAVDEIQGDVLVGIQKDKQTFISFEILDVPRFKLFLTLLAPRITTMRVALEREFIIEGRRPEKRSERLTFVGVTIGFTFAGLQALGAWGPDKITDASFKAGLPAQSRALNDPESGPGSPAEWLVGARDNRCMAF